ncbi:MAG: nucleotidyl transferase AbiEii/AbiGii toxin family protein [Candidatus Omnitrophica bacterium]|nr:nucleotidyl transferase AbiEii/AbiGii toxin family protein [Candidatus Omnitrophota bacterium]
MAERDFEELLGSFNKHKVRYCLVGAFAVAYHAIPRYTKDMDLLIEPSEENAKKILNALRDFGFGALNITAHDLTTAGQIVQLGYEPLRVDLLTSVKGSTFSEIWRHRRQGLYGKRRVWFIGLDELIKSKQASGRPQDRVDVKKLEKRKPRSGYR